jgi:hypothetical protein
MSPAIQKFGRWLFARAKAWCTRSVSCSKIGGHHASGLPARGAAHAFSVEEPPTSSTPSIRPDKVPLARNPASATDWPGFAHIGTATELGNGPVRSDCEAALACDGATVSSSAARCRAITRPTLAESWSVPGKHRQSHALRVSSGRDQELHLAAPRIRQPRHAPEFSAAVPHVVRRS